jgi:hypothetical protein
VGSSLPFRVIERRDAGEALLVLLRTVRSALDSRSEPRSDGEVRLLLFGGFGQAECHTPADQSQAEHQQHGLALACGG